MNDYKTISCEAHSLLELAIMRKNKITAKINGVKSAIWPKDLWTESGAEYLSFVDENNNHKTQRADKIILFFNE